MCVTHLFTLSFTVLAGKHLVIFSEKVMKKWLPRKTGQADTDVFFCKHAMLTIDATW